MIRTKLETIVIIPANTANSICIAKEILVVFLNESNYDCHFIMKQLAKGFEGKFHCLEENTRKYKTFSVPIKRKSKGLIKMIIKLQKSYPTY